MIRFRAAVVVLALCAATLALISPARADGVSGSCEGQGGILAGEHHLNFNAFFDPGGVTDTWTEVDYSLTGDSTGGKSNANIRVLANGVVKFAWNSPDDRQNDVDYVKMLPPVFLPAASQELVRVQGIFDVFGPDPSCWADSDVV